MGCLENFDYLKGYIQGEKAAKEDISNHYPFLWGLGGGLLGGFVIGGFVACSIGFPSSLTQERIEKLEKLSFITSLEYQRGFREGYWEGVHKAWNKQCWNGVWTATFIGGIYIWLL